MSRPEFLLADHVMYSSCRTSTLERALNILKQDALGGDMKRNRGEIRYMLPLQCDSSQVHDAVSSLFLANAVLGSDGTVDAQTSL